MTSTSSAKPFGKAFLGISIYWIVVVSFLLGFASSFMLAAFREFRFHREIGNLKRQQAAKDREIADLRTLPLKPVSAPETTQPQTGENQSE